MPLITMSPLSSRSSSPESSPVLLSFDVAAHAFPRRHINRWLLVTIGCALLLLSQGFEPIASRNPVLRRYYLNDATCEQRGLASAVGVDSIDGHRVVVRVHALLDEDMEPEAEASETRQTLEPDNELLPASLHPVLSSLRRRPDLFNSSTAPTSMFLVPPPQQPGIARSSSAGNNEKKQCVTPFHHTVENRDWSRRTSERKIPLFFSLCTTPNKVVDMVHMWKHFLAPERSSSSRGREQWQHGQHHRLHQQQQLRQPPASTGSGCLVVDSHGSGDSDGIAAGNEALREYGTQCVMKESSMKGQRYELRVLSLIRDAWNEAELRRWQQNGPIVQWFVFGDDDTWWSDVELLRDRLSEYSHENDHILGTFSEARANFEWFGRIAFGGGGIVISRSLMRKMQGLLDVCIARYGGVFGGDGMITHCAALARGMKVEEVVEELPGLSQMDMRGDATGFLTSGQGPFLSLHHWTEWLQMIPGRKQEDVIELFSQGVDAVGSRNMFRRFVYDSGGVVWTVGHSVIVYKDALAINDLSRIEHTWWAHLPRRHSRSAREEGTEKFTYYLASIERPSPSLTLFRHRCDSKGVEGSVTEIAILWDNENYQTKSWWKRFSSSIGDNRSVRYT